MWGYKGVWPLALSPRVLSNGKEGFHDVNVEGDDIKDDTLQGWKGPILYAISDGFIKDATGSAADDGAIGGLKSVLYHPDAIVPIRSEK
ncbi:hypothetical protein Tco_1575910 [Tanacetum coccineum]